MRFKEVKYFSQTNTAEEMQSWDSNPKVMLFPMNLIKPNLEP